MEGYVARFTSMAQVEDWIAAGVQRFRRRNRYSLFPIHISVGRSDVGHLEGCPFTMLAVGVM
jgi:hypothetical protein